MIRVDVKNPDGSLYGYVELANQDLINSWISSCTSCGSPWTLDNWIAMEDGDSRIAQSSGTRTITDSEAVAEIPAVLDSQGNIVTPEIPEIAAVTHQEYNWKCTLVQTDVTAQYNLQQATQQALASQNVGATVVATVAAINESKLAAQTMSQQTFTALLADQNVSNIERLLWNGSLVTAKALIQSVNLSAYYTSDEIASIVAMLP